MKCYKIKIDMDHISQKLYIRSYSLDKPIIIFKKYDDDDLNIPIKTIDINSSDLKNKSIFRYPKLTLPRNKIDIFKKKYDLSITRSKDEADYKIISNEYLKTLVNTTWNKYVVLTNFENYIYKTLEHWSNDTISLINKIKDELDENEKCALCIQDCVSYSYYHNVTYEILQNKPTIAGKVYEIENENDIKEILSSNNLIFDHVLCSMSTEDSVILTEVDYYNLLKMIESKSSDNINLVLEIMANSNIEKSMDVVGLLYFENFNVLKDISTNWQNVNIKTLRKRLSKFIPYGQANVHYYDRLTKLLINEKALTVFAFKIISIQMLNHLSNAVGFGKSVFDIRLEDIKLKSEYEQCLVLNENGQKIIENTHSFNKI
jgi:hypothetical protein